MFSPTWRAAAGKKEPGESVARKNERTETRKRVVKEKRRNEAGGRKEKIVDRNILNGFP